MDYELQDLAVGYGSKTVAAGIRATLLGGQLTCLLGPNGAGKSTLLRTLSAFQPPLGGRLLLREDNGQAVEVQECRASELSRLLGIVLTDRVSIQGMSVRQLVGMGRTPYTNFWGHLTETDHHYINEAMEQVGVASFASRQISTLSDGERQKVMIAKALAQQTPVILLDEPTAFLDFPSKVEVMLLLRRLAHEMGKSIFLSTHDLDMAPQTADRLWLMGKKDTDAAPQAQQPATGTQQPRQFAIGTPQELVNEIPQYFPSRHLSFDATNLRFNIQC